MHELPSKALNWIQHHKKNLWVGRLKKMGSRSRFGWLLCALSKNAVSVRKLETWEWQLDFAKTSWTKFQQWTYNTQEVNVSLQTRFGICPWAASERNVWATFIFFCFKYLIEKVQRHQMGIRDFISTVWCIVALY